MKLGLGLVLLFAVSGCSDSSGGSLTDELRHRKKFDLSISPQDLATSADLTSSADLATTSSGTTYYVSPQGSDSASGSSTAPWLTLQHAADQVKAGDTVIVEPGTYAGFTLGWDFPQNGTAGAPITFLAQPGAVIASRNSHTGDGIDLEGASYVVIDGFSVSNASGTITRAGIRSVTNSNVIIRNNNVDGCGEWGIFTGFSQSVLIENNVASRSVAQHGIYVSNSADYPIVRGNSIWGNYASGLHMNGDVSQGGDGIISGALVEKNVIHDNGAGGGSGINCDGVQSSRFQNNLLYNNHANGISLFKIDGGGPSIKNVVVNNTIVVASNGRWAVNITDGSTGNTLYNDILFNYNTARGAIEISSNSLSGFVSDYNVVTNLMSANGGSSTMTLAAWQSNTGQDLHSIASTPAATFANASGNDYRLSATSPAIDRGTATLAPPTDIVGQVRPLGNGYDIGAYESY